LSTHMSTI